METGRQPYPSLTFSDLLLGRFGPDVGGPWWLGRAAGRAGRAGAGPACDPDPRAGRLAGRGRRGDHRHRAVVRPAAAARRLGASRHRGADRRAPRLLRARGDARRPGPGHDPAPLARASTTRCCSSAWPWSPRSSRRSASAGSSGRAPATSPTARTTGIPPFMTDESTAEPAAGILVIRGDVANGLTYTIRRGDGDTLGENEILYASEPDPAFTADVRALVSRPTPPVRRRPGRGRHPLRRPARAVRRRRGGRARRHRRARPGRRREPGDPHLADRDRRSTRTPSTGRGSPLRAGAARRPGHRRCSWSWCCACPPCGPAGATRRTTHEPRQARPRAPTSSAAAVRRGSTSSTRARRWSSRWSPSVCSPWCGSRRCTTPTQPPVAHPADQRHASCARPRRPGSPDGWVSTASGASGDVTVHAGGETHVGPGQPPARPRRLTGTGRRGRSRRLGRPRPGPARRCGPARRPSPPRAAASRRRSSGSPASAPAPPTTR